MFDQTVSIIRYLRIKETVWAFVSFVQRGFKSKGGDSGLLVASCGGMFATHGSRDIDERSSFLTLRQSV